MYFQRLNALGGDGKKDGNIRTAISAETSKNKLLGNKLPKIEKNSQEAEVISGKSSFSIYPISYRLYHIGYMK